MFTRDVSQGPTGEALSTCGWRVSRGGKPLLKLDQRSKLRQGASPRSRPRLHVFICSARVASQPGCGRGLLEKVASIDQDSASSAGGAACPERVVAFQRDPSLHSTRLYVGASSLSTRRNYGHAHS